MGKTGESWLCCMENEVGSYSHRHFPPSFPCTVHVLHLFSTHFLGQLVGLVTQAVVEYPLGQMSISCWSSGKQTPLAWMMTRQFAGAPRLKEVTEVRQAVTTKAIAQSYG